MLGFRDTGGKMAQAVKDKLAGRMTISSLLRLLLKDWLEGRIKLDL